MPDFFQRHCVFHRVHGLPESIMAIDHQLIIGGELGQNGRFQVHILAISHHFQHFALEKHEAAVDPVRQLWPLGKARHQPVFVGFDDTVGQIDLNGRYCCQFAMRLVKGDQLCQVNIAHVVAVGDKKAVAIQIVSHTSDAGCFFGQQARVYQ